MLNMLLRTHRFVAILMLVSIVVFAVMLPGFATGQVGDEREQASDVNDIDLLVRVQQSVSEALPGDQVEYTATIENNTGKPQTNLEAIMVVTQQADAMSYVEDSTFIRYHENGPEFPLPPLSRQTTLLAETIAPSQVLQVRWSMKVGSCASRNAWAQVVFRVRTDDLKPPYPDSYLYIAPHTDWWATQHFSAVYDLNTPTPAPGEAVHHTVRVVNDGFVIFNDVMVHLWADESLDRFLPTVAENSEFTILSDRDGPPGRSVPLRPMWASPLGRFGLDYLNPGRVLILSWTDYVADDAPVGTVVMPHVGVRMSGSTEWTQLATRFVVSPPRNDFSIKINKDDAGYLTSDRFPGDLVNMRVTISNRTDIPRHDIDVSLDLPSALLYVSGSGAYSTATYLGGNSRQLPDDWIDNGAVLPEIAPGEETTIAFKVRIREDIMPQDGIEVYAVLRSPTGTESRSRAQIDIAKKPDIDMNVRELRAAAPGSVVWFDITVENSGEVPLTDVRFGFEEPCSGMAYIPGTLYIESQKFVLRDDASVLAQQARGEDVSVELGALEPNEKVEISMRFQLADDLMQETVTGPRLIVTGRSTDTTLVPRVLDSTETEITVVPPLVTAEDFEARVEEILGRVEDNTDAIRATVSADEFEKQVGEILGDIQDNTDAIRATVSADEFEKQVGEILRDIEVNTNAIKGTTTAIEEQAEEINETTKGTLNTVVKGLDPWDQSLWWILRLGGFGALASFAAGLVVPFTIWRGLAWFGRRRRRAANPYLADDGDAIGPTSVGRWMRRVSRVARAVLTAVRDSVLKWANSLRRRMER